MELLGQQRDSLGQREQFIRTPELLAKLVDRSGLVVWVGKGLRISPTVPRNRRRVS